MREALKYEICGIEGDQKQLCVDWAFDDRASFNQVDSREPKCSCVFTNHYEQLGSGLITCNQWLNWEGGLNRCEVHEWVYLEYLDHVERNLNAMGGYSPGGLIQAYPVAVTRMK